MRLTKAFLGCLLLIGLFAACAPKSIPVINSKEVRSESLSFPAAYYENVIYMGNRLIAFAHDPSQSPPKRISYAYEHSSDPELFMPAADPACTRQTVYNIMGGVLPDGRLGLVKECWTGALTVTRSIIAYDWQTSSLEQMVNAPIDGRALPRTFTWNPDMTRGIQEMGNGLEGTIYWISSEGVSPMDIEIEDQGLKWNLKEYFQGNDQVGSAGSPAWSPDGNTIAFFASAYGIREKPLPQMNVRHELYLMKVPELKPIQTVPGIANAFRLRWSPDSRQLLFSGCMGLKLQCALWLYDLDTRSLVPLDKGDFQDFTWIDDHEVVAIKDISLPYDNNQIWKYSFPRK